MFNPSNYNQFDPKLLSISKVADDLFYVNRYKIFYNAKELRITVPQCEVNQFTDKFNQPQIKLTCNDLNFNKFIRKVERTINSIAERRFSQSVKLINKNDLYIHIVFEKPLGKIIEFSVPAININKTGRISCKLFLLS